MAAAIMVSAFGCNNGLILAGARVSYAMARDGVFFRRVGTVNSRHVPAFALVLQGVWASALTLPRSVKIDPATGATTFGNLYTQLLEYIIPADLVMYAAMVLAVIVLRRRAPNVARPYLAWGYPIVPVVYIVLAVLLILDLGYLGPGITGTGFAIVLSGVPVYFLWTRDSGRMREEGPAAP
jgi:APA family basic amino acid/polyamine antiporter